MRRVADGALVLTLILCDGCARKQPTIQSAFPIGLSADPWRLEGKVWSGPAAEAAQAVGEDWARIKPYQPLRAWLAVYQHERTPKQRLIVRAFRFASPDDARMTLTDWRPADAADFTIGDAGCFSEVGVMFVWGDVFFDIFGSDAGWGAQMQAAYLAGYIEQKLPPRSAGAAK